MIVKMDEFDVRGHKLRLGLPAIIWKKNIMGQGVLKAMIGSDKHDMSLSQFYISASVE